MTRLDSIQIGNLKLVSDLGFVGFHQDPWDPSFCMGSMMIQNMDLLATKQHELRSAVIAAAASIPKDDIEKAISSLYHRCKKCVEVDGGRFEYKL